MVNVNHMTEGRLRRAQLLAYAAPAMALSMIVVPVNGILPTLYAQNTRVTLVAAGTVFLLRAIYDAVSDMIIGYLSDRTDGRLGPRLPWIIAGALVIMLATFMLVRIPADAGILYFGLWTIIFFTGSTMIGIPHFAWGSELTSDYAESSRVFAYNSFFNSVGSFLTASIPAVLVYFGLSESSEYTPDVVWLLGLGVIVFMPLTVLAATTLAPRPPKIVTRRASLLNTLKSVRNNSPFLRFITAYIIAGAGYGFFVALVFPFISSHLQIGEAFPGMLMVLTVVQMLAVPVWARIVRWLGKHRAWAWGWIVNSLVLLPFYFLVPGPSAIVPATILMGLYAFTNTVSAIAPFALLADVVDYDRLKCGRNHAGQYFAFMMFAVKLLGSAGGLGLIVLGGVFGYDLAENAVNDEFARFGMQFLFIIVPGLFQLISVALIWNFPINERRQGIITRRLARRDARAESGPAVA